MTLSILYPYPYPSSSENTHWATHGPVVTVYSKI
jgi:hypothetical protein